MVDAITAISASNATTSTKADSSLSITSEPDNKWVAKRQAQIDADLERLPAEINPVNGEVYDNQHEIEEEYPPLFEGRSRKPKGAEQPEAKACKAEEDGSHVLSGESDEIGTTNFDEETPFGHGVAIV